MNPSPERYTFILQAIDGDLVYPCLATRFTTIENGKLRTVLGIDADWDPEFERVYTLAPATAHALCNAFTLDFDHGNREVILHRHHEPRESAPYIGHAGYELPLLLQNRKQLAVFSYDSADDRHFDPRRKARFDHYVAQGTLHGEEDLTVVNKATQRRAGQIFYTPKGEEWRIPTYKLLHRSAGAAGGWNEYFERLERSLLGYDEQQTNWWLDRAARNGGVIYGMSLRCTVTKAGLDWVLHSGQRALPPFRHHTFTAFLPETLDRAAMEAALEKSGDIEAFVQFSIHGRHLLDVIDARTAGPYDIPSSMVPLINAKLTRYVEVVLRR
jgi:hypothetical protein